MGGSAGLGSLDLDRETLDNGLGLRLRARDTVIAGRPSLDGVRSTVFDLVDERFPVDAKRDDFTVFSFVVAPYFDPIAFFAAGDTSRTVSLLGNVEYRLVYDVTSGASLLMPALRYVPPEYDGRYDAGEVIKPKRGIDFASDVGAAFEISSLDEY